MTVQDCIEKVSFVGNLYSGEEEAKFSPDGRYFFVQTERGVLQSNELESTIWLFESAVVLDALKRSPNGPIPRPRALVTMATMSNIVTLTSGAAITEARWAADSKSIAFLGRDRAFARHLFTVTAANGRIKQLTPNGQDVTAFDRAKDIFVVTIVARPADESQLYQSAGPAVPPDIQIGTGSSLFTLLYPQWEQSVLGDQPQQVWVVQNDKASPVLQPRTSMPVSLTVSSYAALLSLSPSGRYAIVTNTVPHVPAAWELYEARFRSGKILADKPKDKPTIDSLASRPVQYELIDLQTGTTSALIDAPSGVSAFFADALKALWSNNEKEVIVTNTFLPLGLARNTNLPQSTRPWVVAVEIGSRKITRIKEASLNNDEHLRARLTDLEWHIDGQQLLLRYFDEHSITAVEPELFRKTGETWKALTDPDAIRVAANTSKTRDLSIYVRQAVNEPPVLMATALETGNSRQLWDPNPQFAGIKFGEATIYKWQDKADTNGSEGSSNHLITLRGTAIRW